MVPQQLGHQCGQDSNSAIISSDGFLFWIVQKQDTFFPARAPRDGFNRTLICKKEERGFNMLGEVAGVATSQSKYLSLTKRRSVYTFPQRLECFYRAGLRSESLSQHAVFGLEQNTLQ